MRRYLATLCGVVVLGTGAACKSEPRPAGDPSGRADTQRADTPATAAYPAPAPSDTLALLETSCGGGVTGGGGGVMVTADGRFYRWQRNGPAPAAKRELTLARRDSVRGATLVQAAEREGITRIKYSEPSNVTCSLSLMRGDTTYEVAWPMGSTPRPIRNLVALAKEIEEAAGGR